MVAVKASGVESFLRSPGPQQRLILFFGPDRGLVSERAAQLASTLSKRDGGQVERFDSAQLSEKPDALAIALHAGSLFDPISVVRTDDESGTITRLLPDLLSNPPTECTLIIEAGDLKPTSPLRKAIDQSDIGASIGCYPDTDKSLHQFVQAFFRENNTTTDQNTIEYLVDNLGSDRKVSKNELEKLLLYTYPSKNISLEDAINICGDSSNIEYSNIIDFAFEGQIEEIGEDFDRLISLGTSPGQITRQAIGHAKLLFNMTDGAHGASDVRAVIQKMGGRIHFKRRESVTRQALLWDSKRLLSTISDLGKTELDCRQSPALEKLLTSRQLMRVGLQASAMKKSKSRRN